MVGSPIGSGDAVGESHFKKDSGSVEVFSIDMSVVGGGISKQNS